MLTNVCNMNVYKSSMFCPVETSLYYSRPRNLCKGLTSPCLRFPLTREDKIRDLLQMWDDLQAYYRADPNIHNKEINKDESIP